MPCSQETQAISPSKRPQPAVEEGGTRLRFAQLLDHLITPTKGSTRATGCDLSLTIPCASLAVELPSAEVMDQWADLSLMDFDFGLKVCWSAVGETAAAALGFHFSSVKPLRTVAPATLEQVPPSLQLKAPGMWSCADVSVLRVLDCFSDDVSEQMFWDTHPLTASDECAREPRMAAGPPAGLVSAQLLPHDHDHAAGFPDRPGEPTPGSCHFADSSKLHVSTTAKQNESFVIKRVVNNEAVALGFQSSENSILL
ncbi:hypothetical protein CB1_001857015 [Camelus ferus]|nr:hypothetical protein CB1_001857015 [Camelus ferus]